MFKKCTNCEKAWQHREAFLSDPDVSIIGYQVNFENLQLGYFLFNHDSCRTTLAVHAGLFVDLYKGPIFSQPLTGSEICEQHCLHVTDLDHCSQECECAYVREVLQVLRRWPSNADLYAQHSGAQQIQGRQP